MLWPWHLNAVHLVSVITNKSRQLDLANLGKLLQGEAARPAAVLVPVAIAEPQVVELLGHQAAEGGADHRARKGLLGHAGGPVVNVVKLFVDVTDEEDK